MSRKRVNTKDLVAQIEKITRERMTQEPVVSLDQFRDFKNKTEPSTILVIEDDETMRLALKRIFSEDGHRVITAADGTELSVVLDDSPIDLIILDIGLPWINGFELAQLMKENIDLKSIPLVFVSARTTEADIKRAFSVGADDYIKKPFDVDYIKKSVATLLQLQTVQS